MNAIGLFVGCGGFSEGIKQAGFRPVCAVELDKYACESYRNNFPSTSLFEGDVADFVALSRKGLEDWFPLKGQCSLVYGGPPCQGYSQIGPRDPNDERNVLYRHFVKCVKLTQPFGFIMENVPNMALWQGGRFRDDALTDFERIGYRQTWCEIVDFSEFGVPQKRRRLIFIGIRDDLAQGQNCAVLLTAALDTLKQNREVTVNEAIGDLPMEVVGSGEYMEYPKARACRPYLREMRLDCDGEVYSKIEKVEAYKRASGLSKSMLHGHHTKEIQARRLKLIRHLEQGKKANSLPKALWDGTRPEKWRRLHPNQPSHTVLAQMHRDMSEFIHPEYDRWITVREAMRLQSFHDGFILRGSEWQQLKQVGNAVPPLGARALGLALLWTFAALGVQLPSHTPAFRASGGDLFAGLLGMG